MLFAKILRLAAISVAAVLISAAASAHVTVQPKEAELGETVIYTIRVPSEGKVATTIVELQIPKDVTILSVEGPADSHEQRKLGSRIASIVWMSTIPPGEVREFKFEARNPASGTELVWKAHQLFEDATRSDWVEAKGGKRPASVTQLKRAARQN
ncbi:MAG: DUF1775 domain-containing protein [Rhodospirillaceae bacterium]|nr:DUF1775 domain-containing protein [Rhodospirillaceae bacterium]